jgi:DHA2 family multidrug resistance protein-like MFS transporter
VSADAETGSGVRAGRLEWTGLAVLALPTLLLSLDLSVLMLAVPHLSADLAPSSAQLLWITDIYGFMLAGFLITMGALGDRIGRKRLLLIGASIFGVASVLAAFSNSAEMLIATRAVLGIAAATLMPSTLALINSMFRNPAQRTMAIAIWMSCFMAGMAIGPLLGGVMLEAFWWGSAFLIGVPVMALLLITGPILLPEYRDPDPGRLDGLSVLLSLVAILPIVYGLKRFAEGGPQVLPAVAIVVGALFTAVFVHRQWTLSTPLFDLRLLRDPKFAVSLGAQLFNTFIVTGVVLFGTQYLQLVEGLSPMRAGLWLVLPALAMITGSLISPALAQRSRPGFVSAAGMAVVAVGSVLLVQVDAVSGLALAIVGFVLVYFGCAPLGALATDMVVGSAPPEKAGAAAALSETSGQFGIAMGVAVLGSVGTAVYRNQLDNLPPEVSEAAAESAHDSLAGAVTVAGDLPPATATTVLDMARDAFVSGFNVVAIVCVVIAAAVAAALAVLLRHVRPSGSEPEYDEAHTETGDRSSFNL